jgi:hypothetical protein
MSSGSPGGTVLEVRDAGAPMSRADDGMRKELPLQSKEL